VPSAYAQLSTNWVAAQRASNYFRGLQSSTALFIIGWIALPRARWIQDGDFDKPKLTRTEMVKASVLSTLASLTGSPQPRRWNQHMITIGYIFVAMEEDDFNYFNEHSVSLFWAHQARHTSCDKPAVSSIGVSTTLQEIF
jgi:hypothetical protein